MPFSSINSSIGVTLVIGGTAHPGNFTLGPDGYIETSYGTPETVLLEPGAAFINAGNVRGTADKSVPMSGTGIYLAGAGLLLNNGNIIGGGGIAAAALTVSSGEGGNGPAVANDNGGYGVILHAGGTVEGYGFISGNYGGTGGQGYAGTVGVTPLGSGGTGGGGGVGGGGILLQAGGVVVVNGLIYGGDGGRGGFGGLASGNGVGGTGGQGGDGGDGIALLSGGSVVIDAGFGISVAGGNGGRGGFGGEGSLGQGASGNGGKGGAGLALDDGGTVSNAGRIRAGDGGNGDEGGAGGLGVQLGLGARMVSTGNIFGGIGGYGEGAFGAGGAGGDGAFVTGATLLNEGRILGGYGGTGAFSDGGSGAGVVLAFGGVVSNSGSIGGQAGQSRGQLGDPGYTMYGGDGGNGVIIYGGVLINSGTISGGKGGFGLKDDGRDGDAVLFGPTGGAGTLEVEAGAMFIGNVVANHLSVLELAGTSSVALESIGTQFLGFEHISFAPHAQWTIGGDVAALLDGQSITGFAAGDAIILDDLHASSLKVTGKAIDLFGHRVDIALDVSGQTKAPVLLDYSGDNSTISQAMANGKLGTDEFEYVSKGATDTGATIAGGTLDLLSGARAVGPIAFAGTTGGTLILGGKVFSTETITGFGAGDVIKLENVGYVFGASVAVTQPGIVTITDGSASYNLNIAGAVVGETSFKFGPGSVLTMSTSAPAGLLHMPGGGS